MTVLAQRDGVRVVGFNKCGHTSIINTFRQPRKYFVNPQPAHIPASAVKYNGAIRGDMLLDEFHKWPKPHTVVAVIRNPVHRALSAYQHFLVRKERYKFTELGFKFGCSFPEFVAHLQTIDLVADDHLRPYTSDLLDVGSGCENYILIPLELIAEAWPAVVNELDLDDVSLEVWHKNKGEYQVDDFITIELYTELLGLYLEDYSLWRHVYSETRASLPAIRYKTSDELIRLVN